MKRKRHEILGEKFPCEVCKKSTEWSYEVYGNSTVAIRRATCSERCADVLERTLKK